MRDRFLEYLGRVGKALDDLAVATESSKSRYARSILHQRAFPNSCRIDYLPKSSKVSPIQRSKEQLARWAIIGTGMGI